MNDETRLKQRLQAYAARGPASRLTFEAVVTAGRRARRRRLAVAGTCLAAGALVAGGIGAYAVNSGPAWTDRQAPGVTKSPDDRADEDRSADRQWTIDEILSRPLTAEEIRIGEELKANLEAELPDSATVGYERMDQLATTGYHDKSDRFHELPEAPYVEFYVSVKTDRTYWFYFASWSRNRFNIGPGPDLRPCENPVNYCAETDAGQVIALDGSGTTRWPDGASAPGELGAVVFGPDQRIVTLTFATDKRTGEPDPQQLELLTTEQLGQIVSDPTLLMREGTEGIDPRAAWSPPPEDPGTDGDEGGRQAAVRAAFVDGVQASLDSGAIEPGEVMRRGKYYGGSDNDDAAVIDLEIGGDRTTRITGVFTRGDARPADSDRCDLYRWGGQTCRSVPVDGGVVLVLRSGHLDYDQSLGQHDMDAILLRDDGTGVRVTQFNFDPEDPSSVGADYPLTEAELVSLVQDPDLDYRG